MELAPVTIDHFTFSSTATFIRLVAETEYDNYGDLSSTTDSLLYEEEVRRLHSFLSQWLENNQKDHF